jgi:D-tyrosyl-tRNA(Tyr) deacylase
MRVLLQRVRQASVHINEVEKGAIQTGLLLLLGICSEDAQEDIDWLCKKIAQLRIFNDAQGKMNKSLRDIEGEALVISQFTLFANNKKGTRPSFTRAARPEQAIPLYEQFIECLQQQLETKVQTGEFGADMQVSLVNDGPVTLMLDSKKRDF